MRSPSAVAIVGAGLAGSEAALAVVRQGGQAQLYEMRPVKQTAAHRTAMAAELVCSNSFRSAIPYSAPWLLKQEIGLLGGELLRMAAEAAIPAGTSLAVDRTDFSRRVTARLTDEPRIHVCREEVRAVPHGQVCVVATGPLTSDALAQSLQALTGEQNLSFFDALNPIVDADTIDLGRTFTASRYGRGGADYLNCPLTEEEYGRFHTALLDCASVSVHDFDRDPFFGCPPLEKLARSGVHTLRYGPMKPVGLVDPSTGRQPYAVVQLRRESLRSDSYNMVGFQNQLTYGDQKRVFRMIPGLENAEFVRFGQMHRNTYVRAPRLVTPALNLVSHPHVFLAGQLCGVEGYVESMATGVLAGMNAWRYAAGLPPLVLPRVSGLGAICHYLANANADDFAPVRLTFDLLPNAGGRTREARRARQCERALAAVRAVVEDLAAGGPAGAGANLMLADRS